MSSASNALEAAPVEEALPSVPCEGLSLAALRAFAAEHEGTAHRPHLDAEEVPFEQLTTAQVCAAVVKPATDGAAGLYLREDEMPRHGLAGTSTSAQVQVCRGRVAQL